MPRCIVAGWLVAESLDRAIDLYCQGRAAEALQAFLCIDSDDDYSREESAYYLGLCCVRLERWEEALLYLEQIVTISQNQKRIEQCRYLLFYAYTISGRTRLAEYEFKRLSEDFPESAQLFCLAGYSAHQAGRAEEAIDYYERALLSNKSCATALNCLGYILAETGQDLKRSLSLCRQALDLQADNPLYLDSMGWSYYLNGMAARAKVYLKRAHQLDPDNMVIAAHLEELRGGDDGE